MTVLSLLVPGLLGPMPELAESPESPPRCAPLQHWLARADMERTEHMDYTEQLAALLGVPGNVSVAQLSARVDGVDLSGGHVMRADPVHFRADLDHALLISGEQLAIDHHEAETLIEHFNAHFAEDGLQLECAHAERWYLKSARPFRLDTVPVHHALGRNVQHFLPTGEDEMRWRSILNEAQMLLFGHDINLRREAEGRLTVNSVWLWGEGEPVEATTATPFDWIMADEITARGLARATQTPLLQLDFDMDRLLDRQGAGLVVIDAAFMPMASGNLPAGFDALQRICAEWIEPLHRALKNTSLQVIHLYTGDGRCYRISPRDLLKFWRRAKPLRKHIYTHA